MDINLKSKMYKIIWCKNRIEIRWRGRASRTWLEEAKLHVECTRKVRARSRLESGSNEVWWVSFNIDDAEKIQQETKIFRRVGVCEWVKFHHRFRKMLYRNNNEEIEVFYKWYAKIRGLAKWRWIIKCIIYFRLFKGLIF